MQRPGLCANARCQLLQLTVHPKICFPMEAPTYSLHHVWWQVDNRQGTTTDMWLIVVRTGLWPVPGAWSGSSPTINIFGYKPKSLDVFCSRRRLIELGRELEVDISARNHRPGEVADPPCTQAAFHVLPVQAWALGTCASTMLPLPCWTLSFSLDHILQPS